MCKITSGCLLLLLAILPSCAPQNMTYHDFTGSNRNIAALRMDAALCQQVSQNVPQLQPSTCTGKADCIVQGISTGLENGQNAQNAFTNCMAARGWEQVATPAPMPAQQAAPVQAPFTEGKKAYFRKDYSAAMQWWQQAANQGNIYAETAIGELYCDGLGVPQNYSEAMKWYRKAADEGLAFAQLRVGMLYMQGLGVQKNYQEALKWTRKAADSGDPLAQNNLGWLYHKGWGVKKNGAKARHWFELSAQQGNDTAKANLALLDNQ